MKLLDDKKKTILLTGASGKIGDVLCEYLLANNYNVIGLCRRKESAVNMTKKYFQYINSNNLFVLQVDLFNQTERDNLVQVIGNEVQLYGMIHNARNVDSLKQDKKGHIKQSDFMSEFELGVYAPYDLAWQLANSPAQSLRRVINVASIYGVVATNVRLYESKEKRLPLHYGVVKSALIHLTKELAVRLAEMNVTVNAVSYGGVEGRVNENFSKRYAALCPQESMLKHEDLAGAIGFLLAESSRSITGHNLMVDGGWTVW